MMDNRGCFALMLGDESQADGMSSAISSEGVVILSGHWYPRAAVSGVASPWRNSTMSSCTPGLGTPSHVPNGRPALMKWHKCPVKYFVASDKICFVNDLRRF